MFYGRCYIRYLQKSGSLYFGEFLFTCGKILLDVGPVCRIIKIESKLHMTFSFYYFLVNCHDSHMYIIKAFSYLLQLSYHIMLKSLPYALVQ